jgi:hypothetical protein
MSLGVKSSINSNVCPNSSAVEHLVYTEIVGGSIPSLGILHIVMDKPTRGQILDECYQNLGDYYELPCVGLMADWYLRYWALHNMVCDHFDASGLKLEDYDWAMKERQNEN